MKQLRIVLISLLIAFSCTAGVFADAADPGIIGVGSSITMILLLIVLSVILSAIGVAIWIIIRSGKK